MPKRKLLAEKDDEPPDEEVEAPTKTRKTRSPTLDALIKANAKERGVKDARLRISFRSCSLRRALAKTHGHHERLTSSEKKKLVFFHKAADNAGLLRHVVGLIADRIILRLDDEYPVINKTFYDQVWSSLDKVLCGKKSQTENRYLPFVQEVVGDSSSHAIKKQHVLELIGAPLLFEQRQDVCKEMSESAQKHVEQIPARAKQVLAFEIRQLLPTMTKDEQNKIIRAAQKSLDAIPVVSDFSYPGFADDSRLVKLVRSYQQKLPLTYPVELLSKETPTKKESDYPRVYTMAKKMPHLLFPLMKFVGACLENYYDNIDNDDDFDDDRSCDECSGIVDDDIDEAMIKTTSNRRGGRWPRRFAPLPRWKNQPAFLKYSYTHLDNVKTLLNIDLTEEEKASEMPNMTIFLSKLFNIENVKQFNPGYTAMDWYVTGFRTNGASLLLQTSTAMGDHPEPFNAAELVKSGYQLIEPESPIVLGVAGTRGTYKCSKERKDVKLEEENITIVAVDPGEKKPISVCEIRAQQDCEASGLANSGVMSSATYWDLTSEDYKRDSGRNDVNSFEERRRQTSPAYSAALARFENTRYRTCNLEVFDAYLAVVGETLGVMGKEKRRVDRKRIGQVTRRRLQKTLDCIANKLLGKGDKKDSRAVFFGSGSWKSMGMPRKKLVKSISVKGVCVITDEYKTSKTCPLCGCGSIEDVPGNPRVRRCSNARDGGCQLSEMDRDHLGALNIALCGHWCLKHRHGWPAHLCRPATQNQT